MIQFYVMMIKKNKVTIDDVPVLWKAKVVDALKDEC